MSFKSLNHILGAIQKQADWQKPLQSFQSLLDCWPEVVGAKYAAQTRPVAIQRDILLVATSSSTWAQELTLRRHSLLKKLNTRMSVPIVDIRFSTPHWQNTAQNKSASESTVWQDHPSYITEQDAAAVSNQTGDIQDPQTAFQHWADSVRRRSQHLLLCPQCQCPTPPGELHRWDVCAVCATKQW